MHVARKLFARAVVLKVGVPRIAAPASLGNLLHMPVFGPTLDLPNRGQSMEFSALF